jgi:hypothetical protein
MTFDPATVTIILTCALIIERIFNYSLVHVKKSKCCGAIEIETRDPNELKETEINNNKNELPPETKRPGAN